MILTFQYVYVDQTPTPTRFLRTCEESGLFQELEEANPFEQDFKDATPTGSSPAKQPLSTSQSANTSMIYCAHTIKAMLKVMLHGVVGI